VTYGKAFEKQLKRVPKFIEERALTWIAMVEASGIQKASKSNGVHDEPLQGKRWGQRSIRLNRSYRLIYKVIEDYVHIELLEVHKHDY
jgi:proteic killer suppression protein